MTRVAWTGVGLFLFIPLVLVLYLRMPLGLAPSILIGIVVMLAHRFVARPFMERYLSRRCFWCGRVFSGGGFDAGFVSRGEAVAARGCRASHAANLVSFARVVGASRPLLVVMILVPVAVYLVNALAAIGGVWSIPLDAARWGFKIPIAAAVVGLSFAWPFGARMTRSAAIDFPAHNLFLLGVRGTLWVFRLVGIWWLAAGVWAWIR